MNPTRTYALLAVLSFTACPGPTTTDAGEVDSGLPDGGADAGNLPSPIRHIIVLVKENRTFDHYFSALPGVQTTPEARRSNGTTLTRPRAPDGDLRCDIAHSHAAALVAWRDGGMNGFDRVGASCRDGGTAGDEAFVAYDATQLPAYYEYAREFTICDRFFSAGMMPSAPGHFAVVTGQTPFYGNASNASAAVSFIAGCGSPAGTSVPSWDPDTCATTPTVPCFDVPAITDELPEGFTWRAYASNAYAPGPARLPDSPFNLLQKFADADAGFRDDHVRGLSTLLTDLAQPDLPNLVFINISGGNFLGCPVSEHPPASPCCGEAHTVSVVNAVIGSGHWNDSLVIVTWDDWGGYFDHVAPKLDKCLMTPGFRLPTLLISPWAKKGVFHEDTEHASIPRLIRELWGLRPLAVRPGGGRARDTVAGSLLGAFDFQAAPRPPLRLTPRTCY